MVFSASLHSIRLSNIVLSIHQNIILKRECIPVGCVPSAAVAVGGGVCLGGQEVSAHGVCLPGKQEVP